MIKLSINDIGVEVHDGSTLLDAAKKLGIQIPTMCYSGELEHFTSCMICLVKDKSNNKLLPSCSALALEGMSIVTDDIEIKEARKTALELLLSEHVGDCEAPCRIACPAFMDIPLMNRLIEQGKIDEALRVVREDIALPAVLGRICPAPCESACKRKPIDEAVSICLLKRFTADYANTSAIKGDIAKSNKKVAIIGAGPAGLSAAYYLRLKGVQVSIFDSNSEAGGALRYSIPNEDLDKSVLDSEIEIIKGLGVEFVMNTNVDHNLFQKFVIDFDAVVIATGDLKENVSNWGLESNEKQLIVDKSTYQTNIKTVFGVGNVNRSTKLAIRSAGQGKEVAKAILQMFDNGEVVGEKKQFNSTIGKLLHDEFAEYLKEGSANKRQLPDGNNGFDLQTAKIEASRCLHCDCRKKDNCFLRIYSDEYNASKKRFSLSPRKPLKKIIKLNKVIYEPGKCIKCGICVRITSKYKEQLGLTFIGRGFDVEIGVPFNEELNKALDTTIEKVIIGCPTGALSSLQTKTKEE
jgi:hypothetical protein